jgi:hypothetical protein
MMSPSPDRLPPLAKLIASAGFRDLECPRMYASGFPGFFAEQTPLVRDYDHFLALLGGVTIFAAQQTESCAPVLRARGPGTVAEVAGGKFMSAFVRAVES